MITMSKISICTAHNSANDEKTDMIKSNHGLLTLVLSRGMKDLLNECEIGKLCSAVHTERLFPPRLYEPLRGQFLLSATTPTLVSRVPSALAYGVAAP